MIPSPYQHALYNWTTTGEGSAVVIAVAGSGKTTTLIEICKLIPRSETVRFFAFNKAIADVLKAKVHASNVIVSTYHSSGYQAVLRRLSVKVETDRNKMRDLVRSNLDESDRRGYGEELQRLVSLAKGAGVGILLEDERPVWQELIDQHDLEFDYPIPPGRWTDEQVDEHLQREKTRVVDLARELLLISNDAAQLQFEWRIDFDDQLYLPILWDLPLPQYDWVLVDEAQDTNRIQREFLRRSLKPGGRLIAVGDPHQCQPAGTLVERAIKKSRFDIQERQQVPIETISVGDVVTSTSLSTGQLTTRRVVAVAEREYKGELLEISARGSTSRYTPNHRCVVKHHGTGYCTYVMRRHHSYRIGMARLCHANGSGPLLRMRAEDAESVWILATYATKREAQLAELKLSAYYHLPQLMFTAKQTSGCLFTQEELDSTWREIHNADRALACLEDHGRLVQHPYFSRGQVNVSFRRPHVTVAANILPGTEVRLRGGKWAPAHLSRQVYSGTVYSLAVEKEQMYFADGILTHNSIYGWRGASQDAIDHIQQDFQATTLPLSVCYRCASAIVEKAKTLVEQIEPSPAAVAGEVRELVDLALLPSLTKDDAILCRNNAPLVKTAYDLIAQGVPCQILGRDIGEGLKKLIYKLAPESVEDLELALTSYKMRETKRYRKLGQESKAQGVEDRVACICTIIESLDRKERTIEQVIQAIEGLFGDGKKDLLTLSTIHKAKGQEWPRVALIRSYLMPFKWAVKDWQIQQEQNLQYVAWTRAQETLWIMDDEPAWMKKRREREQERDQDQQEDPKCRTCVHPDFDELNREIIG